MASTCMTTSMEHGKGSAVIVWCASHCEMLPCEGRTLNPEGVISKVHAQNSMLMLRLIANYFNLTVAWNFVSDNVALKMADT